MTTFVFKDPSGRTHEVVGPAGATQEQAFAVLQQRLGSVEAPEPELAQPEPPSKPATGLGERIATGLMDPVVGLAQLADRTGIPGAIRKGLGIQSTMDDVVRQRDAEYVAPGGVDWGRMAGNVANPVNYLGGGAGLGRAIVSGAAQSALAPVEADLSTGDYFKAKATQAGLGGATAGALAKVLPRALGGVIKPTDDALALQRQGIGLTPGQAAGGFLNKVEQRSTSIPVVGDIIGHARRRSLDDFQQAAIRRATGSAARTVDEGNAAISELYQGVVPKLKPTGEAAVEVLGAVVKAADNPELTAGHLKILEGLHDRLFGREGERYMQLSGGALKDLDTELGALGRKYEKSVLPSDQTLGEEIRNIQSAMRKAWRYHLDPEDAAKLDAANRGYREMVPVNKASSSRADERVMPRALQKALARQAGRDVSRMPRDALVDPAVRVLPNDVPDSGTAGRLMNPLGVGVSAADPLSAILATLGTAGAYSRTGSNILTGNTDLQRQLAKMAPAARKALVAALRAQQAGVAEQEEQ